MKATLFSRKTIGKTRETTRAQGKEGYECEPQFNKMHISMKYILVKPHVHGKKKAPSEFEPIQ